MIERIMFYIGAVAGAYVIIIAVALGQKVYWWVPLVWVAVWVVTDIVSGVISRQRRARKLLE